ncbi:potassium ABC transporter permease [Paenibacillus swuensis]|uniref:Potassium ABC transporter permease n=1 Tax=Paenibacillus swuensis TaxID=1178515 RepID=A0A172TER1_9BACL|nr:ABC transporter permease [Paenibacillus swuensis]ANE45538.1 potassium ABC transporter permease [Paenibacillus swuensis]
MHNLGTVIGFTVRNKLRTKSFVITSLVIALIISVVIHLPLIISLFDNDDPRKVGVIDSGNSEVIAGLDAYFAKQEKPDIVLVKVKDAKDESDFKKALASGDIEGYLEVEEQGNAFPTFTYKSEGSINVGAVGELETALQVVKTDLVLQNAGLTDEQKTLIYAPIEITPVQISAEGGTGSVKNGKTSSEIAMAAGVVYVTIILLFMGIMGSGQLIASEITAEKSSRVMEVLITSVNSLTQMFGKIIGMFIVGITQILLFIAVGVINFLLPHNIDQFKEMDIHFSDIDPVLVVYAIVFYLLGYFMYATLFAAVGSLVSRTEDLGQAVMPLTFLSLGGFYIAIFGLSSANAPLIVAASFIPFFSPYAMILRIGTADPALWEIALSIAILVASIAVFGWLSARIYRTGVLMYGKRPSMKELRKAMRAYKS